MSSEKSLFCPLAATQIEIDTDGRIRPCCYFQGTFGNVKDLKKEEVFNSPASVELQKNLAAGIPDSRCSFCWKLEEKKISSSRLRSLKIYEHYRIDSDKPLGAKTPDEFVLRSLDLKQSNLCNLKCRTCSPYSSSKWTEEYLDHHLKKFGNDEIKEEPQFKAAHTRWFDESFWKDSESRFKHLEKIDFYGGEPLLDPQHRPFLNFLIERGFAANISLVYGSNGSMLQDDWFLLWKKFKRVKFQVSLDGIEKVFEYLRFPAKWSRQIEVLDQLRGQKDILFGVTLTYSILNLMHLPETLLWLRENQIDFVINPVIHPAKFNPGHLPAQLKKIVINSYNQLAVMHPWMKPYLNEVISFMKQTESDPFCFDELKFSTLHADAWRKQNIKDHLPLTYELVESVWSKS